MTSEWNNSVDITYFTSVELGEYLPNAVVSIVCEYAASLWQFYWYQKFMPKNDRLPKNCHSIGKVAKMYLDKENIVILPKDGHAFIIMSYDSLWASLCNKRYGVTFHDYIKAYINRLFLGMQLNDICKILIRRCTK